MKNFFQRKPDTQPSSSRPTRKVPPNNDPYKVWLPPPDAFRAPAPTTWAPANVPPKAPKATKKHRSSSRAPAPDASSAPAATSSAYKYATMPNNTGFYYSNNPPGAVPLQPFPSQYHPSSLPQPGSLDQRPESRLGYVPYPYQNQPQLFAAAPPPSQPPISKRREDSARNTAAEARGPPPVRAFESYPQYASSSSSKKNKEKVEGGARHRRSSSSVREEAQHDGVESRKDRHRTNEPSEKRRDSQVGESRERHRDGKSRRDGKTKAPRDGTRGEEADSSDSSMQRPSSSTGHRRRHLEEAKSQTPAGTMASKSQPQVSSRLGVPMQPTAASSSSGKHTPQIPRMPVYLPARSHREESGQLGLSESDTDHGTHRELRHRGGTRLRGVPDPPKQDPKPSAVLREPAAHIIDKKVKESKGLWPFSRSRSSQKLPQATTSTKTSKTRADSTPAQYPPPSEPRPVRPESRRHASESATGGSAVSAFLHPDRPQTSQESRLRPSIPEPQPTSRTFLVAQAGETASRSVTTASQQAALHALRSRAMPSEPPRTMPNEPPSGPEHSVPSAAQSGYRQTSAFGPPPTSVPIEPFPRRDMRDKSNLPPIYAPAAARAPEYPKVMERAATPKVSQLVAGFEARSSDMATNTPAYMASRPATQGIPVEKTAISQVYAPAQLPSSSQTLGDPTPFAQRAPNHYATSAGIQPYAASDAYSRPVAAGTVNVPSSSNTVPQRPVNPTDPPSLKKQLRDLLSDKPSSSSRKVEKLPVSDSSRGPEVRPTPVPLYPASKPADWPSSAQMAFPQPPIHVFNADTFSVPLKPAVEKSAEIANTNSAGTSRRPDIPRDYTDRGRTKHREDGRDVDRPQGRSSRKTKDPPIVSKTPSKESPPTTRHTPSPAPLPIVSSTNSQSRYEKPMPLPNSTAQPSSTYRTQPRASNEEFRPQVHPSGRPHPADAPSTTSNLPPQDYRASQKESRNASSAALPDSTNSASHVPSNIPHVTSSSRSAIATSGSSQAAAIQASSSRAHTNTRPSADPGFLSSSHMPQRVPSEESLLRTPSSLAPSVLPPVASRTSIPASFSSQVETRKKGIFGMFRSSKAAQEPKSSASQKHPAPSTQSLVENYRRDPPSSDSLLDNKHAYASKGRVPPPIEIPSSALPIPDRKSPNRVFTPFRYLTSKRYRTVSSASMDAVDGTAPNTVMGSPTASMQSSQMPLQPPPQRDPRIATQDWRNKEESGVRASGKHRRLRPGVVFDVAEDPLEETRRSRPARIKKARDPESADRSNKAPAEPATDSDASQSN